MHYSKETPFCSTFRVITTNVLGVRIFRKFTVYNVDGMLPSVTPFNCMMGEARD